MDVNAFVNYVQAKLNEHGKSVTQMCRDTGLARQNFFHWKKGRAPNPESVKLIAEYLGLPQEELRDILENGLIRVYYPKDEQTPPPGYVVIPEYELQLSAGNRDQEPEWVEVHASKPVVYDEDFFIEHGVKPSTCKRAKVLGDSMEPFLYAGDRVTWTEFPDPHVSLVRIVDGDIYVISIDGAMKVKRLSTCKDGVVVVSDNADKYPPETYVGDELERLRIYGKVLEIKRAL